MDKPMTGNNEQLFAPDSEKTRGVRRFSQAQRDALYGYVFIAPQLIGFIVVVLLPLLAVFVFSTQERNLLSGSVKDVGLDNFEFMLNDDPFFGVVLKNSLIFTAWLVPLNVIVALVLALLLNQKIRGIIFFRTLFFAPVLTSAVAWAVVWRFLLQENSGVNSILASIGIDGPNWLREGNWAMFSVVITRVLKNVGLNMIIFMAALQNIPEDYNEAAKVDGANLWQRVWYITIPLIAPTIVLVILLTIIGSLKAFDHILLMTGGGPANATNVLVYYIYFQAFKIFQTGYASALAVVLFVITVILTIAQWLVRRRFVYSEN